MPTYRFVVADVFTSDALAGNQLAVFTDGREIPEHLLQKLARETNFSDALDTPDATIRTARPPGVTP